MRIDKANTYIHFLNKQQLWLINSQSCRSAELTPLYIDRYKGPRQNTTMDYHSYWELFVVFKGNGQIKGVEHSLNLKKSDICLIPPNTKHAELSDDIMDTLWIGLEGHFLNQFDCTQMHIISSENLIKYTEQLWLRSIKPFGPIGPELDGIAQTIMGLFLKLISTTDTYSHEYIEDILLYINKNYMNDLSISSLAGIFGCSESYFYRIFKKHVDQTPVEYITNVRIQNAAGLLKNSSLTIKRISRMSGFNDSLYFSRIFKRITGHSPKEFR